MQPAADLKSASLRPEVLVEHQRRTIAEHVRHEQAKDWPNVYNTFTPIEDEAYYDVVPFQVRFPKIKGVRDFYETFAAAFPDFQIIVHTESDLPGLSIREVQIEATHRGEYGGLPPTGRRVSVQLIALFVFDQATGHLNAERIYFDNNTIMAQIRGELSPDDVFDLRRIERPDGSTA
jgi:predicted ester cyclase